MSDENENTEAEEKPVKLNKDGLPVGGIVTDAQVAKANNARRLRETEAAKKADAKSKK